MSEGKGAKPVVKPQFEDEPEPIPTQTLLVPWDEAKLRRTVKPEEWIGCWRIGVSGYFEFLRDGTARQKFTSRGASGDFEGSIRWQWIDERLIRIHRQLRDNVEMVVEHRVIRFDGKKMWTECKYLDGPAKGIKLTLLLFKAPRPKSWR